ncbi:MAG: hypothetical protein ABI627_26945 [Polyangiaceae bacterium]
MPARPLRFSVLVGRLAAACVRQCGVMLGRGVRFSGTGTGTLTGTGTGE